MWTVHQLQDLFIEHMRRESKWISGPLKATESFNMNLHENECSLMKEMSASKDPQLDFIYMGIFKCDTAELHCLLSCHFEIFTLAYSLLVKFLF